MSSITIKNGELATFKKILKHGHAIGEGGELRRIIRELNHANIPIHHGYSQGTEKVVVVMGRQLKATPLRRSLTKTVFKIE